MRKLLISLALVAVATTGYVIIELGSVPCGSRGPASIPAAYETLTGCEKQKVLWTNVQSTAHKTLPSYSKFGLTQLAAMGMQEISLKGTTHSDFAPKGWVKYLHRRGAVAKVKIVPKGGKYTGIFQGAECGIVRLSLTYATSKSKPVAPGLALKVLRNGVPAANVSALVSLEGQGQDFNFFRHSMSNIVPKSDGFGQKLVHRLFSRVSKYPEELGVRDLAAVDALGVAQKAVVAPRQLFFVPGPGLAFAEEKHEVRGDFAKIKAGTTLYGIYAVANSRAGFDYAGYTPAMVAEFLKEADHVADIVTTSEFIASEFGDDGIFFRHELRPLTAKTSWN